MKSDARPDARSTSGNPLPSAARPPPPLLRLLFRIGGYLAPGMVGRLIATRMFTPRRRQPRNSALLAAAQRSLVCNGERLQFWSWQKPGAQATVLLVHGWEGLADDLVEFVPGLLLRNFNVVVFDAPAHGRSSGTQTDVHRMADAIAAVSAEVATLLAPVRVLVAHSVGAAAATIHLSRGATGIERLVMIAPGGELASDIDRIAAALSLPRAAQRALVARIEARYGKSVKSCSTRLIASRLRLPVLIMHDRDDRVVPFEEGQALAAVIGHAQFSATSMLGHRSILGDPGVLARVAEFCAMADQRPLADRAA